MSVKRMIHETDGIFFITITCYSWMSLLQITNTYDAVYKWFDWLKKEGHYVAGYVPIVIGMPNHIHALIAFSKTKRTQTSIRSSAMVSGFLPMK